MRIVDRGLSMLLILGAAGHTLGVLDYYKGHRDPLFWSLTATLLILLLAAVNLLRADRPDDRGLAWVAAAASTAYIGVSIGFGIMVAQNPLDPRAIGFGLIAAGLMLFSLRTALSR